MTLYQITSAIQATEREILSFGSASFGYIARAYTSGYSCQIIVPIPRRATKCIPAEAISQTCIIFDTQSLQTWLNALLLKRAF